VSPQAGSRWLLVALAASLALNIAAGAFLLGRSWLPHHTGEPWGHGDTHGRHWEHSRAEPPGKTADAVRQEMQRNREALQKARANMMNAREAANAALRADPYDPNAHAAALAELRRQGEAAQALLHASLVDAAGKLDRQGRQQLADWRRHHGPLDRDKPR
jgi:Spy/CpxP family protein refolding chaperone